MALSSCPYCGADLPADDESTNRRACPACGKPSPSLSDSPTVGFTTTATAHDAPPTASISGSASGNLSTSTGSSGQSRTSGTRFAAGTMLGERYRILGLLGRGGMGEVYRADDLRLGESVALKFLPPELAGNPQAVQRLRDEVRVARRVTHPNVCRVHDLDEIDGTMFLSMEFVDGEDLSSLLRRIGRLPHDKAVEIAREVCSGLVAAHEQGILHRDLKPANIMLDGRGTVRLADFGIALLGEAKADDQVTGTPTYMAPELLAGEQATVRSDLYALGLVLYEVFTGKQAVVASSLEELRKLHDTSSPVVPSEHVPDLDPGVESAILDCLARDPAKRPRSAISVAAALPGQDPLAALLAAGETPSPELVAAAGGTGNVNPILGACLLALVIAGLFVVGWADRSSELIEAIESPLPPEVLAFQARELASELGYPTPPVDRAYAYNQLTRKLQRIDANDSSENRWERIRLASAGALQFWYRESQAPLEASNRWSRVGWNEPPQSRSGMLRLVMNTDGGLARFEAEPPYESPVRADSPTEPFEWDRLFAAMQLSGDLFEPAALRLTPKKAFDERRAWTVHRPDSQHIELHVEAAAYQGKLTWMATQEIWTLPGRDRPRPPDVVSVTANGAALFILLVSLLGGVGFGIRNLLKGRGDRTGATRIAIYYLVVTLVVWFLKADHTWRIQAEFDSLVRSCGYALFTAVTAWFLYVALEPAVRRVWPRKLTSWNRFLQGEWRDPLVGRDVVLGVTWGVLAAAMIHLHPVFAEALGAPPPMPTTLQSDFLLGTRRILGIIVYEQTNAAFTALMVTFLVVFFRAVLRKMWLVLSVLFVLGMLRTPLPTVSDLWALDVLFRGLLVFSIVSVVTRGAFLTVLAMLFSYFLLIQAPLTYKADAWYRESSVLVVVVLLALASWGLWASLRRAEPQYRPPG